MLMNLLRKAGWIFVLSFAFLHAYAQQNAVLKGTVKSSDEMLGGATVTVGSRSTTTGADGSFSISVKPGTYNVTVSFVGYKTITRSVSLKEGETLTLQFELEAGASVSEVVVLGSRSRVVRSNTLTPVPVDVFSVAELTMTGNVEPTQMINMVAPSFNSSRQTIADGTDHIDPATLRGLGPDQVLLLLNGKRRHNTALVNINGTIGRGSVGTDMNAIPTAAIERLEILRDGASSQYGSDAIAGVINVVLRKGKGTSVSAQLGQQYAGDGEVAQLGVYQGFNLGKNGGHLSFAGDLRYRGATNRVGTYTGPVFVNWNVARLSGESDAAYIARRLALYNRDRDSIAKYNFNLDKNMQIGNSQVLNSGLMMNGALPFSNNNGEFYFAAGLNYRNGQAAGFYRYPFQTSQLIPELYPLGFLPEIHSNIWDKNVMAGVKLKTNNNWRLDISNTFGGNSFEFNVKNSLNASQYALGARAQTEFEAGRIAFNQNTFNFDASKDFGDKFNLKSFNLAMGAEWRTDFYRIVAGEEASWRNYDPQSGKVGGAQVFPGFQPSNAVMANRTVLGAYVDLESDLSDRFMFNVAGRFENYSDFGSNFAGKLAMRYKITDALSLRGAVSNGFRAPSIHQFYFSSVSTQFVNVGGNLTPRQVGTFRNNSEIARAFGIPELKAERSKNASFGITLKPNAVFSLTIDGYFIRIDDRIVYTSQFNRSNPVVNTILTPYPDVNAAQFFTNAINTETKGIDVVASLKPKVGKGSLEFTLAGNFNQTNVVGNIKGTPVIPPDQFGNVLFSRLERSRIEVAQPRSKITLSSNYKIGKYGFYLRFTRFGEVEVWDPNPALDEKFSPKVVTDMSIARKLGKNITVVLGANNLFDVYPDPIKVRNYPVPNSVGPFLDNSSFNRFIYSRAATQFGFNGGYYYINFNWSL